MIFTYLDPNNTEWQFTIDTAPHMNSFLKIWVSYPKFHKETLNYTQSFMITYIHPQHIDWGGFATLLGKDYIDFINRAVKLFVTFS